MAVTAAGAVVSQGWNTDCVEELWACYEAFSRSLGKANLGGHEDGHVIYGGGLAREAMARQCEHFSPVCVPYANPMVNYRILGIYM